MSVLRRALVYVLCALLMGAGIPTQQPPQCQTQEAPRSCCVQGQCHCSKPVQTGCPCKPRREEQPRAPLQKQPLALREHRAAPRPEPAFFMLPLVCAREDVGVLAGVLPHRERHLVLSVFRI